MRLLYFRRQNAVLTEKQKIFSLRNDPTEKRSYKQESVPQGTLFWSEMLCENMPKSNGDIYEKLDLFSSPNRLLFRIFSEKNLGFFSKT